jgi:hypothetical protein
MNLCRSCDTDFSSVAAFDCHRTGVHDYIFAEGLLRNPPAEDGRRCMAPEEMLEAGMDVDPNGRWRITPRGPEGLLRPCGSTAEAPRRGGLRAKQFHSQRLRALTRPFPSPGSKWSGGATRPRPRSVRLVAAVASVL